MNRLIERKGERERGGEIHSYINMEVNNGKGSVSMEKNFKNQVIKSDEFISRVM